MNQPEANGCDEPIAKRTRSNIKRSRVNQEQCAHIFKLNFDCFVEVFDYLRLKDLISVGKTCKGLLQVAGYCFQLNYSDIKVISPGYRCLTEIRDTLDDYDVDHFIPFIKKIAISSEDRAMSSFVKAHSKFQRLKQIKLYKFRFDDVARLKKIYIMNSLEVLHLTECDFCENFDEFIDKCAKLKCLKLKDHSFHYWYLNDFFNRNYPTLEQFIFFPLLSEFFYDYKCIATFLKLNPNIRKFETDLKFLWKHRHTMMVSNIKLDELGVNTSYDNKLFTLQCDLLDKLYARGFYKKLQFKFRIYYKQEAIDRVASLNGLNKLILGSSLFSNHFALSKLNTLEELQIHKFINIADIDKLPNVLINLKHIQFFKTSVEEIMSFIKRSVVLQKITVQSEYLKIIDVLALQIERKQLPHAQKVTLYVHEETYLATKYAFGQTNFGLIQLKRNEID